MVLSDNKLLREGARALQERLPDGWTADIAPPPARNKDVDAVLVVRAPDGRTGRLLVEATRQLEPRGAAELAGRIGDVGAPPAWLAVARYLSPGVRERLREARIGFLDLTGNVRLQLSEPGLFIATSGADADPDRAARSSRSLRGAKAGRVVRALVDSARPPGVRELAERSGIDPGYVSRVLALLDREALVERRGRGRTVAVDWPRLLRRWAESAPLEARGEQRTFLEPRGIEALKGRLRRLERRFALTGTLAAGRLAPVAPPRLAAVYVDDLERAASELGLRPADAGANVLLIEPADPAGVFTGAVESDGLVFVAASQAAADLLTSPGRGPAEADALITWMSEHEEAWRG
jgi:DNA-binding transcriptional ArsR family regulator